MLNKLLNILVPKFQKFYLKSQAKVHRTAKIVYNEKLNLGKYIYIGPKCFINAEGGINLGAGTILAPEVVILSSTHDYQNSTLIPYDVYDQHKPVAIGSGVWIGYRAMICPGVTIGDGAVVAMGSVVTKSVLPGQVVGGNPATVISNRDNDKYKELISNESFFHKKYWSGQRIRIKSDKNT